jgi:protein-disulfide isomerase
MTTPAATRRDRRAEQRQRAREEKKRRQEQKPSALRSPLVLSTVAALVVGLVIVGALIIANRPSGNSEIAAADDPAVPAALVHGRVAGDSAAPVTIDLWSDFQCPVCGHFARDFEPLLRSTYIADGTVRLVYHDYAFIGQESIDAAAAARAAEALGGSFWAYHDLLFANQGARENGGAFTRSRLADIAVAAGLDRAVFQTALDDPEYTRQVLTETQQGSGLGIQQTPTLIVGGVAYPGVPQWDQFKALIEKAKASAQPGGASPAPSPSQAGAAASP